MKISKRTVGTMKRDDPVIEKDVVLIHFEDSPAAFARVESITADNKKNWYRVKLLILAIPLHPVTWILKEEYINGCEFTMDGRRVRLEKVPYPHDSDENLTHKSHNHDSSGNGPEDGGPGGAKVIRFPGKK